MDDNSKDRFDIAKIIVLSGWSLTILVCLVVIGMAVYSMTFHSDVAAPLKEWGGMCLGFLLGSFVSLVKDFIKPVS
jgi:hypothetical protein